VRTTLCVFFNNPFNLSHHPHPFSLSTFYLQSSRFSVYNLTPLFFVASLSYLVVKALRNEWYTTPPWAHLKQDRVFPVLLWILKSAVKSYGQHPLFLQATYDIDQVTEKKKGMERGKNNDSSLKHFDGLVLSKKMWIWKRDSDAYENFFFPVHFLM
jgi:hypothetical protein